MLGLPGLEDVFSNDQRYCGHVRQVAERASTLLWLPSPYGNHRTLLVGPAPSVWLLALALGSTLCLVVNHKSYYNHCFKVPQSLLLMLHFCNYKTLPSEWLESLYEIQDSRDILHICIQVCILKYCFLKFPVSARESTRNLKKPSYKLNTRYSYTKIAMYSKLLLIPETFISQWLSQSNQYKHIFLALDS